MTNEQYKELIERLDRNYSIMNVMLTEIRGGERTVTVKDISKMLSKSEGYLRGDGRRFLPNYGESDYPGKIMRWKWDTWIKWRIKMAF